MKNLFKICLMLAGLFLYVTSFGQKPAVVADNEPGWHKIGEINASFKKQNESIHVLGADEFTAIKIRVKDAPIHIERLQVFYESGDMEDIDVKSEMKAGASSGAFQLKHPDRDIAKVAFTYHTVANSQGDKAGLELYGLKTNQPSGADAYNDKVDKTERDLDKAQKETRKEAREAAREVEKETEEAADKADAKGEKTESDIERAADKTADQVSETAAKGTAEIKDRRHDTKVGPDGQVIYIDNDSRYYFINEEGKKVFVTEMQLKDK